jgi:hypothetical protein
MVLITTPEADITDTVDRLLSCNPFKICKLLLAGLGLSLKLKSTIQVSFVTYRKWRQKDSDFPDYQP